jgi:hypothetical protein
MLRPIDGLMVYPMLALVLLTFGVALVLLVRRVRAMRAGRIHPQSVATARDMAAKVDDHRTPDNFRNLFETPVLFYAAMLAAIALHGGTWPLLVLAWLYVALRVLHSLIHCTYNRVMHRFAVFVASMVVLFVIWCIVGAHAAVVAAQ